jgi:hypothetical protein
VPENDLRSFDKNLGVGSIGNVGTEEPFPPDQVGAADTSMEMGDEEAESEMKIQASATVRQTMLRNNITN